jgi:transposase
MTHDALKAKRQKIAAFIAEGHSYREAAIHFDVAYNTAYYAAREYGVKSAMNDRISLQKNTFGMLAELLKGRDHKEIATEFGVTIHRIRHVAEEAERVGLFELVKTT